MEPVRMRRVAVVAPEEELRDVLVDIAESGVVELDTTGDAASAGPSARLLTQLPDDAVAAPVLSRTPVDPEGAVRLGRGDLLAAEAQLEERSAAAVHRGLVAGVTGWVPEEQVAPLAAALEPRGAAVVPLPAPRGVDPPTLVHTRGGLNRSFAPLMDTYATVPYVDVDPTVVAGLAFVVMYGMMFADAGQGALLVLGGLLLRLGRPRRLSRFRSIWPFLVGAGVSATFFGVLFGEFFGPTGVLPVLWIEPLEEPVLLLLVSVGIGACLLSGAYVLGTVNRWREGGWRYALVAPSGIAGIALFLGLGLLALGAYAGTGWLVWAGVGIACAGLVLAYVGLYAGSGGGAGGAAQAGVELFDGVIRLGTNLVSFARLAAFGLAHAALGAIVWQGTTALWDVGSVPAALGAVLLFVVGNVLTFTLQAVVAGVQALRLEYYELFSRVFVAEGRPFQAWHLPVSSERAP
ncbi:MAG: V-type ATPase 116kDa subunit family protein [Candidatus Nanopelagicales bacterium]